MKKIFKTLSIFKPASIKRILSKLYESSRVDGFGRTKILSEIIEIRNYRKVLEIGVWDAQNLFSLADSNPNCHFFGVDPYLSESYGDNHKNDSKQIKLLNESDNIFNQVNDKANQRENVTIIRKKSLEATKDFDDNTLDLIFIDALHTYKDCKNDIINWLPKVKSGGLLCGHDYNLAFFGVVQAVSETLGVDNVYIKTDSTWFYEVK